MEEEHPLTIEIIRAVKVLTQLVLDTGAERVEVTPIGTLAIHRLGQRQAYTPIFQDVILMEMEGVYNETDST